jgi:3-isopropylmalate/(R)-2-methylmalate dehydratase small subunit
MAVSQLLNFMLPFHNHTGIVAPLNRANVDTDQIIPKQFLKRIERTGFGQFLFYDWAHLPSGEKDWGFVLNQRRFRGATILIAGNNFGCGSSREHAPWALADFGFRVIIAPSFADIFATNCVKNGILTVTLADNEVAQLIRNAESNEAYTLTVDLKNCAVTDSFGYEHTFVVDAFKRRCLLEGLDDISLSLEHADAIAAFESRRPTWLPTFS